MSDTRIMTGHAANNLYKKIQKLSSDHDGSLAIGEALVDIISTQTGDPNQVMNQSDVQTFPGGAPANAATYFAFAGGKAFLIANIGDDEQGQLILEKFGGYGVNLEGVTIDAEHPTSNVLVAAKPTTPVPIINREADAYINEDKLQWDIINPRFYIQTGCFASSMPVSRKTIESVLDSFDGIRVIDPNYHPIQGWDDLGGEDAGRKYVIETLLPYADIVTPSAIDAGRLFDKEYRGMDEDAIAEHGVDIAKKYYDVTNGALVIFTMSEHGSIIYDGTDMYRIPTLAGIETIDATGAGDAHNGAFLRMLETGKTILRASTIANVAGSYAVRAPGAIQALPSVDSMEQEAADANLYKRISKV